MPRRPGGRRGAALRLAWSATTCPAPRAMSHQPKLHHLDIDGLSLACYEWRAALRGTKPTLWMVHAR